MLRTAMLAGFVLTTTVTAAPPRYRAVELEAIAPNADSVALDINADGIISGAVSGIPGDLGQFAVIWTTDGQLHVLDPQFDNSAGQLINDAGIVAGVVSTCPPLNGVCEGQLGRALPGGEMVAVGALDGLNGDVTDMNAAGDVAGWWYTDGFSSRAILYTERGGVQNLGTLGGFASDATAMNDDGLVVGASYTSELDRRGFYWNGAGMEDLGTLGGDDSTANDVNDSGVIIGSAQLPDGTWHAFRTTVGNTLEDLHTLPGTVSSEAMVINDAGVIGGTWTDGAEDSMFVWTEGGGMVDVGRPDVENLLDFFGPSAINADGTMVGIALTDIYEIVVWMWRTDTGFVRLDDLIANEAAGPITGIGDINDAGQVAVTVLDLSTFDQRSVRLDVVAPEDLDADGTVGITDLIALLAEWGPCEGCIADVNGDGFVSIGDLLAIIAAWS